MRRVLSFSFCYVAALHVTLAVVGYAHFVGNPFPVPDWGHRAFGVPSEDAQAVVVELIRRLNGPERNFTFEYGPTRQTLLLDGFTVVNLLAGELQREGATGNALSLPVKDPREAAAAAVRFLNAEGFPAEARDVGEKPNRLMVVRSNAFNAWELVLRRHALAMGRPRVVE